jgi:hypothetical protein
MTGQGTSLACERKQQPSGTASLYPGEGVG